MNLKKNIFLNFLKKYKNKKILFFGFTSLIWRNFLKELENKKSCFDLSNSTLIHGGGWKKLINENISNVDFKKKITKYLQIKDIINYYGMVEQTGSIFLECKKGFFHTSVYNDILIRDKNNLSVCKPNKLGIIQVFSSIPKSYPGHSILTEDEGILYGIDNCKCGLKGKYFKIIGRLENSVLRGCSDVY